MIISWTRAQTPGGYDLSQEVLLGSQAPVKPTDPVIGPVAVQVNAHVDGHLCVVEGDVQGCVTQPCVRCLTDVVERLNIPFREVFSRSPLTQEQEENDVMHVPGEEFELEPLIGQAIYLHMSLRPLCDEACKGLCPSCGVNRNVAHCDCDAQVTDPRLDVLASFLEQHGDGR